MGALTRHRLGCAALALGALIAAPVPASGTEIDVARDRLEQVEQATEAGRERDRRLAEKVSSLAAELKVLRRELAQANASAQQQEEKLASLELRLAELNAEAFLRRDMLDMRRNELASTLGALSRLSRRPATSLIAAPGRPIDMLRSAQLLAAVTPALEAEAEALKTDLEELEGLRQSIAEERRRIDETSARLAAEQQRIRQLSEKAVERREQLAAQRRETQQHLASLGAEAKTLQALVERLQQAEAEREEAERLRAAALRNEEGPAGQPMVVASIGIPPLPSSAARNYLAMPVRGRLIEQFGVSNGLGQTSKGIKIATRTQAQVVAPHDGKVVFADRFRDYGQLLIIDPGEGYHILLAGMSQLYAVVGQTILAGEPVGEMGTGPKGSPALYLELRRKGKAINPLPWIAADKRKVSG